MAEETVQVIIVGRDQISKVFEKVGDTAAKEGRRIERSFGDKLQDVGKKAAGIGKVMSIGLTAPLALFGGMAVNSAIKAERLTKTLEGMAGGAEGAAKYITAIKDASLGTVPQIEALEIANRALSFQVVKNADEMANLTEIGIALGRAQGLDAARAVSDLTTALSRQSPMILDNLGITLKLTEAYDLYADKIGKSVEQLTAEEKAIAFREGALIKGMDAVERMGGLQDDAAAAGERAKAQMKDLATELGKELIPFMSMGVNISGKLIGAFQSLSPEAKKVAVAVGAIVAATGPALAMFGKVTSLAPQMAKGLTSIAGAFGLSATQGLAAAGAVSAMVLAYKAYHDYQKKVKEAQEGLNKVMLDWQNAIAEAAKEGDGLDKIIVSLANKTDAMTDIWNADGNALEDVVLAMARAAHETGSYQNVAKAVEKGVRENAKGFDQYKNIIDLWNMSIKDARLKIVDFNDTLDEGATIVGQSSKEVVEHMRAFEGLGGEAVKANQAMWDLYQTEQKRAEAQVWMNERTAEQTRLMKEALKEQEPLVESTSVMTLEMVKQGAAFEHLIFTTGGAEEAARDYTDSINMIEQALAGNVTGWTDASARLSELNARQEASAAVNAAMADALTSVGNAASDLATRVEAAGVKLLEMKAASEEAAREQANLVSSMKDATQEIFNQQVLAAVDPADIGVDAWAALGQELELLTPEQVKLAEGAQAVIDAFKEGIVPTENMAEATKAIYEASEDLNPEFEAILDEYARAPGLIGPTKDAMEEGSDIVGRLNEQLPDTDLAMIALGDSVEKIKQPVEDSTDRIKKMDEALRRLPRETVITVKTRFIVEGTPPPGYGGTPLAPGPTPQPPTHERRQFGGMITGGGGPLGAPAWFLGHIGEYVSNPYRRGAMGGPGGPPAPGTQNNYGGNTYNVTINDRLAMAMFLEQQRKERYEQLTDRL